MLHKVKPRQPNVNSCGRRGVRVGVRGRHTAKKLPAQLPDAFLPADQQVYQRANPVREDDNEGPDEPVAAFVGLPGKDLDQHPYPKHQPGQSDGAADQPHRKPEPAERAGGENRAERMMHSLRYRPCPVSQAHGPWSDSTHVTSSPRD